MNVRELPPPDPYASPPRDGRVLEHYGSHFEAVLVALHPFLRRNLVPREKGKGDRPSIHRKTLKCYEPVTWTMVLDESGLNSIQEIDLALQTMISGLSAECSRQDLAARLEKFLSESGLEEPGTTEICPFIQLRVLQTLRQEGYSWVWVGDEFSTERKLQWIEDVEGESLRFPGGCLHTPDKKFAVGYHWDTHFTFVAGGRSDLERIADLAGLEGFFCRDDTQVYWSLSGGGEGRRPEVGALTPESSA